MLRSSMVRATRAAKQVPTTSATKTEPAKARNPNLRASIKDELATDVDVKQEDNSLKKINRSSKRSAPSTATRHSKRIKTEDEEHGLPSPSETDSESLPVKSKSKSKSKSQPKTTTKAASNSKSKSSAKDLSDRKVQAYFKNANQSPFPAFKHPTPEEAKLAHRILAQLHGERTRPEKIVASKDRAGCGDSPSVLDALVRTILSQNTSDKNSTRAKRSMDEVYGGSDRWEDIVKGGESKLQEAIKSGGLSVVKSKVIISILKQAKEKYGEYSLDHLQKASDEDAMREMLSFQGVGPKTASCVLLFCLQRESFAVDTHVHRITGLLGWRPKNANREETHSHLDVMIPDEDKYGLHILLVKHGKVCDECKAGGKNLGHCELRKAFRQGKIKGEAGEDIKKEEVRQVKEEDGEDSEWFGV